MKPLPVTILGIRHHGPGSAGHLVEALNRLEPDCVLIEGPPEGDGLIPWAVHPDITPPVALLVYDKAAPLHSTFYPFAEFSPEWQAMRFACSRDLPVRFMDLPQAHQLAMFFQQIEADQAEPAAGVEPDGPVELNLTEASEDEPLAPWSPDPSDPLDWFARQAGYADGESWWEHAVEERLDAADLFAAVKEAMQVLREQFPERDSAFEQLREQRREAYMRKIIRDTVRQGFSNIAVVCGAWHAPVLERDVPVKDDNALLRQLPKIAAAATWAPWTYGRLARGSGYGAGVAAPGWYDHLWRYRQNRADNGPSTLTIRWLIEAAGFLRQADPGRLLGPCNRGGPAGRRPGRHARPPVSGFAGIE